MTSRKFDLELIRTFWEDLGEGEVFPVKSSPFRVVFARGESREMRILFEFGDLWPLKVTSTEGFECQTRVEDQSTVLEVTNRIEDESFFSLFSSDLVALASDCDGLTPIQCAEMVVKRIEAWQRFMKASAVGFSKAREAKLFAELTVLQHWLDAGGDETLIDEIWQGELADRHDFYFREGRAWEVKAVTKPDPIQVRIESLEELDTTHYPRLSLLAVQLEPADVGDTVADLVERLTHRFKTVETQAKFKSKVLGYGFNPERQTRTLQSFLALSVRAFDANTVPRLVPHTVPGIVSAKYEILLVDGWHRVVPPSREQDFEELLNNALS